MLGGGGYVAGPVGLAAVLTRTPLVLSEADSHLGISNRALARRARRVCLAFPLEGARETATGSPAVRCHPRSPTAPTRGRSSGIGESETCVLVFGGSLGARSINQAAIEAFKDAPYRVVHVAGTRDYPDLTAPGEHYVLLDYLTPFGTALAAADAAVARSGGSVFELAQYGLPSVLIPYPHASADHQTLERPLDGRRRRRPHHHRCRADTAAPARGDRRRPARPRADAQAALALAKPDAARDIAHEILAAVTGEEVHPSG